MFSIALQNGNNKNWEALKSGFLNLLSIDIEYSFKKTKKKLKPEKPQSISINLDWH